jgi:cyclopropane fatty-acyl-phospholipid synthase-like methyltransferase
MTASRAVAVARIAEQYYDSTEADEFYWNIWGGEDIHIGLYNEQTASICEASRRTVKRIAATLSSLSASTRVLDLGAGYGGAARLLAETYGASVCCLNLSETQNRRNRELNRRRGLADKVGVVHGTFEDIPRPESSFDVVWSQDAILHSGDRRRVLSEAARVLVPGGQLVFTDPMQADDCPAGVLGPVLDRIHLESLGSFAGYRALARDAGLREVECIDLSEHLVRHYARVREELLLRYDQMVALSTAGYVERMIQGLSHWIRAGRKGYLAWGILRFCRPQ